jgi:hypothetical protein
VGALTNVTRAWLCASALSATAFAQADVARAIHLYHGPLRAGEPRIFDVRTQSPNAQVLIFRTGVGGANVPVDPTWPALAVAPGSAPLVRTSDAHGRVRIVLPATTSSFGQGHSFYQALVRAPDGRFEASSCVSVRRSASVPSTPWLNETTATPFPASAAQLGAHAVLAVDVDRDADRDLFLANDAGVVLWLDQGAAGYIEAGSALFPYPGGPASSLASADVDRDGDLDLFTGGAIESSNVHPDRLWRNDGTGQFTLDPVFPPGDGGTAGAEFGDIDGDGDPDLVVAHGSDGHSGLVSRSQLYRNQGGTFVPDAAFAAASWNEGVAPAPAARLGDVDDDGDLDLFVARSDIGGVHNGVGEQNRLLINDGTGAFSDETSTRFATLFDDNSLDAAFADLDLDGDLDLVVANSVAGITPAASGDLWINQGGAQAGTPGFFVEDTTSPLESTSALNRVRLAVQVGDADNDGDPDLLVLVHDLFPTSQHMLLLNQGGAQLGTLGQFQQATWFDPGNFVASAATWLDRDFDGDPELLVCGAGSLTGDPITGARVLWLEAHFP